MIIAGIILIILGFIFRRQHHTPSAHELRQWREEEKAHDAAWVAELDKNIAKNRRKRFGHIRNNRVKDYDQLWMN